jgi:hypothetical protein
MFDDSEDIFSNSAKTCISLSPAARKFIPCLLGIFVGEVVVN